MMYGLPADTWIRSGSDGLGLLIYRFGYGMKHSRLGKLENK
jgi:hypothetical protein